MSITIKEYFALTGSSFTNDDAGIIGPVLQEIAEAGDVTAEDVVQAAHSSNSPLRNYFEWDDAKAAHKYRVIQAGEMIDVVRVRFVSGGKEHSVRAYHVVTKKVERSAWDYAEKEVEKPSQRNDVVSALRELDVWRLKYMALAVSQSAKKIMTPVLNQIAKFRDGIAGGKFVSVDAAMTDALAWSQQYGSVKSDATDLLGLHIKAMVDAINQAWTEFGRAKSDPHLRRSLIEEENDELHEQVRLLEEAAHGVEMLPPELKLTAKEERVVNALLARDVMTKEAIMTALYSDRPNDVPEIKIVDVFVCKIRSKIKKHGLKIDTHWGRGYSMPPDSKAELRGMIAARKEDVE
jgi:two-component system, cell cycle response regulator CtrA